MPANEANQLPRTRRRDLAIYFHSWGKPLLLGVLGGAISCALSEFGLLDGRLWPNGLTARRYANAWRQMLPEQIILVRHGQSEGNVNERLYRSKPDNLMELTERGSQQAVAVGKRIRKIVGNKRVHLYVSPFQRTIQTARNIAQELDVVEASVDPRIREQEFGNLQGNIQQSRREQEKIRRFWYRFPTGESGADVYDRTKQWWEYMLSRHVHEHHADVLVVVTHGLAMRLIMMQLFQWSPTTFHSLWNAENCGMYVFRKDLSVPGHSPYVLDEVVGDKVKSSIDLVVTFDGGKKRVLTLTDYVSVPRPRTLQIERVKRMLAKQHGIDPATVVHIDFWQGRYHKFK